MGLLGAIGATIAGGLKVGSSVLSAQASKKASKRMAEQQQKALDETRRQFDISRADNLPFLQTGQSANYALADLLGIPRAPGQEATPLDFRTSPGYEFRFNEGVKAIDRGASASGLLGSGSRLKALTEFGQNIGAQEYDNQFRRLAILSGRGQETGAQLNQLGSSFSRTNAGLLDALGQTQAAGILGRNSAYQRGIEDITQGLSGLFGGGGGGGSTNTSALFDGFNWLN